MAHVKIEGRTGCLEDMLGQEPASALGLLGPSCSSEIEAFSASFRAPALLVLVLSVHMLCSPAVPSTTSACMQLWYNPALTPAPYPIPNPWENAVVDPDHSGPKPAVTVSIGSFHLTVSFIHLELPSRFQSY